MTRFISAIFTPVFSNPDEARLSSKILLITAALFFGLLAPLYISYAHATFIVTYFLAATVALLMAVVLLNAKGWQRTAAIILSYSMLALPSSLIAVSGDGVRDVAILIMPASIVVAGMLLDDRPFIVFIITTIVCLSILYYGEMTGIIYSRMGMFAQSGDLIDSVIIIVITGVAVRMLALSERNHLDQAHKAAAEAAAGNEMLRTLIAAQKQTEEELRTAAREKEMLLKEIHHRVKNNMQIISSLLSLQSDSVRDDYDRLLFKESQDRIKSMSLVHEKLYSSNSISQVNFREYLNGLITHLHRSYALPVIRFEQVIDDVMINVDTAIPCGLIVTELVTNAIKYAFPDGRKGNILISFHEKDAGSMILKICDNGIGIPEGFDWKNSPTLGLSLVISLTGQLDGKITKEDTPGTAFTIQFKQM